MIPTVNIPSRIKIGLSLAIAIIFLPAVTLAIPHNFGMHHLSVRAAGMGETGAADYADLANVSYNPAHAALLERIQANWTWTRASFSGADWKVDGGDIGGGYHFQLNKSFWLGGGLAFGYTKEQYGWISSPGDPPDWSPFEKSYRVTTAAATGYKERIRAGIGLSYRDWRSDNADDDEDMRVVREGGLYDAGLTVSSTVFERNGYQADLSAAFTYFNFGGKIETTKYISFLPMPDPATPDHYRRYGLNLRCLSPSIQRIDDMYRTTLPAVSITFNYDYFDYVSTSPFSQSIQHLGGEIGILGMLFVRAGRISQDASSSGAITYPPTDKDEADNTWGLGLAAPFRTYAFRFDFAQRKLDGSDTKIKRYAILFEADL